MSSNGWIMPYVKQNSLRFAAIIALAALTLLCAAMLTFTSGYLISKASLRPENILMLYVPIVGVRTFGIARSVLRYVERLLAHSAVLRVLSAMRVRLYDQLEPHALRLRGQYRTGDLLGVMSDDLESLQNMYVRTIFPAVAALIVYGVVVGLLGWFDPVFAGIIALYVLVLVAIVPFASLYISRTWQQQLKQQQAALYSRLTDTVMGLGDLLISGRQHEFADSYAEEERAAAQYERKLSRHKRYVALLLQIVVGLVVAQTAVWATGQVTDRSMDATMLAAFVLVMLPITEAFLPMTDAIQRIPSYEESVARLDKLNNELDDELNDELNDVTASTPGSTASNSSIASTSKRKPAQSLASTVWLEKINPSNSIQLRQVHYTYPGEREPVLRNVNLTIEQGKRIAIIGPSGAGKSTLLKLIQGAYEPDHGQVLIHGQLATQWQQQIHQWIAVLNQKPYLFDTTLLNNIRLSRPEAAAEEVEQVLDAAQLSKLIAALPLGYHTPMQEAGRRFSGGERQRIALARVLLQQTPIVILDEPTVGLDPRTERELLDTILGSLGDKTMIWVTHRLVRAEQMDEIVFIDEGEIVMRGSHQQLYATSERYRHLYRMDHPVMTARTMEEQERYVVQA
ncbi:thiol reductant ABC exporter subunit CydC [Paenibacillus wenxiniae]|uniref:Thiol reductant ABC exporter subunit CydC n=1 Tax=Paenibacillus wenxiniae TaxID=1636843 RepID=A0ABW4RN80_9BACL